MAKTNTRYIPPFTITASAVSRVAEISEILGRLAVLDNVSSNLRLRRINRIRTIQGSLAIEGNTLTEEQITAILEGKRVLALPREIQEVRNAVNVYDLLRWIKTTDQHPLITGSVFHYEFEFIHPFADGNGRMGRLWQTLILSGWNPLFSHVPVENIVYKQQSEYYAALNKSTANGESSIFIDFMLSMILDAVKSLSTPEVAPEVTPEVKKMLLLMTGEMTRKQIQEKLGLKDEKHFREAYQQPAVALGFLEMTIPGKPKSRLQKYRITPKGAIFINDNIFNRKDLL